MKNIFNGISVLLALSFVWTGCTQYTEYEADSTGRVETLLYPSDGFEIDLINNDNANLTFEWEASGNGTSLYEVIVYGSDGTEELGRFESDGNGTRTMLTMKQTKVIELADMAGIVPEGTEDLYWTAVTVSNGSMQSNPPKAHKLTVTRDASTVGAPLQLYLTGEGTEAGAEIASALPLRSTGEGTYEIFATLDGTFSLVNRNSEGARREFYATSDSKLTENPEESVSFENGIYRIRVDFNNNAVTCEKINSLKMNYANGTTISEMEYAGGGIWKTPFMEIKTIDTGWPEDRYRFVAEVGGHQELWSSDREDDDASAPSTLNANDLYFRVYEKTDAGLLSSSYKGCYKFYPSIIGLTSSVVMDMSGDIYRHYFTFEFTSEAPKVQKLTSPEDGASVELQPQDGAAIEFSWEEPELEGTEAGKLPLTSYSVVLFGDSQGTARLSSFSAAGNGAVTISHVDIEAAAAAAGIPAGETGVIYWGVESEMISYTSISALNSLNVTRMKGIPDQLYLTGSATEYGTGYGKMKKLDIGKFEIYTKLSSGSYAFTDGEEGDIRKYVIDGDSFVESETDGNWNDENIYRITVDAVSKSATTEKIGTIYMKTAPRPEHYNMNYIGKGKWETGEITPDFTASWEWGDDRFNLFVTIDDVLYKIGGPTEKFNNSDGDCTENYPEGSELYKVCYYSDENVNADNYHYKVYQPYRNQNSKKLNIELNCSPDVNDFYYVFVEYFDL